jgi:hypothetical protein
MPNRLPATSSRQPGLREVLLVAGLVVALVLAADAITHVLPGDVQNVIVHTPIAIAVLVLGTAVVLWRILRAPNT